METEKNLKTLNFYLRTGQLPWYQNNNEFSVSELFLSLNQEAPVKLYSLLRKLLTHEESLKRFIFQFDDKIKQIAFRELCNVHYNRVNIRDITILINCWNKNERIPINFKKYKTIIWHTTFYELIINKSSEIKYAVILLFNLLEEILKIGSSVEKILIFLSFLKQEISLAVKSDKSEFIYNLTHILDAFNFYIIYKLSDEYHFEKNLKIQKQFPRINGKTITTQFNFNKEINKQTILEIKTVIENSSFKILERIKEELVTKKMQQFHDFGIEKTYQLKIKNEYSNSIINKETNQNYKHSNINNIPINRDIDINKSPYINLPYKKLINLEQRHIQNAGLILIWPYLPALFKEQNLLSGDQNFKDFDSQMMAISATNYLIYGRYRKTEEYELGINKLICGFNYETPIPTPDKINEHVKKGCDTMLKEIIKRWSVLKNKTVYGLRTNFLQREGKLSKDENGWKLQIDRNSIDILLDKLSWNIAVAVLPWCPELIFINW